MRACVLLALAACLPPVAPAADNVIDLRYRVRTVSVAATRIYGFVGERSLAVQSRCKMAPTDSEAFAIRSERCGGVRAWYWGMSRLLLEQANSRAFTPGIVMDHRHRWIDLPTCD